MNDVNVPRLRAACLRGITGQGAGSQAIVSLSAEQFLRLPLPTSELERWQARIGQRVWVDLRHHTLQWQEPASTGGRHA